MHHVDPEAASAPLERQAERFASAMLVPAAALQEEWPDGRRIDWPKLVTLKSRWECLWARSSTVLASWD